ncbi:MAG: YraN family protein [Dehalococcoidia bacterium]
MTARMGLGRRGEALAAADLARRGYRVVARNVRLPPWGEIDIVAEIDGLLALVEVRTRQRRRFGGPLASLTPAKRWRMLYAAQAYLTSLGDAPPVRLDLIGVALDTDGRLLRIDHIENAVESG